MPGESERTVQGSANKCVRHLLTSLCKGALHALWQTQDDEILGRIEVLFSGLVNDPDQVVPFGGRVSDHRIEFSHFE